MVMILILHGKSMAIYVITSNITLQTYAAWACRQFKQHNYFYSCSNLLSTPINNTTTSSLFTSPLTNILRWNPKKLLLFNFALAAVGSGVYICVYYLKRETVPYSNRTRYVILSQKWEKFLGERVYEDDKKTLQFLPVEHHLSVMVASISKEIIQVANKHANGVDWNWEVSVVQHPEVSATCDPGGKILVNTGLLKQFTHKGEIATIIGHEIGHAIARHAAEDLTKSMVSAIFQSLIFSIIVCINDSSIGMIGIISFASDILIHLPFSRKREREADYLGLLLMASAGYDPRIAPKVYDKFALLDGESLSFFDKLSTYLDNTHPPSMERAKLLNQAHVMEEALAIYEQARIKKKNKPSFVIDGSEV